MTVVSTFIAENFYYLFLGVLVLNLFQRKHQKHGEKKRFASLLWAIGVFGIFIAAQLIINFGGNDFLLIPVVLLEGFAFYHFREKTYPFSRTCIECGKKLDTNRFFFYDSNLCADCSGEEESEKSDESASSQENTDQLPKQQEDQLSSEDEDKP